MTFVRAKFNSHIDDVNNLNGSKLWQISEDYLHLWQDSYKVTYLNGYGLLDKSAIKPNWVMIVLKIISFMTIILPLMALCIREKNRREHLFIFLKTGDEIQKEIKSSEEIIPVKVIDKKISQPFSEISQGLSLKENIARFIKIYELKRDQLRAIKLDLLEKLCTKSGDREIDLKQLPELLKSRESYFASQEAVVETVYNALYSLLKKPVTAEKLKTAKTVYKQVAAFLRIQTDKYYIDNYKDYLSLIPEKGFYDDVQGTSKPFGYLVYDVENGIKPGLSGRPAENHSALYFLMKNLRKQIKLADKLDKVKAKIKEDESLKKIPPEVASRAFKYLRLTWMHGTKANIIKSACEKSQSQLLPFGELKKRKLQVLTGAIDVGGTGSGINMRFISGVNLPAANRAITYAEKFPFNEDKELKYYERFFKEYKYFSSFTSEVDYFNRSIEAIGRLKVKRPEIFERDKERIRTKINDIHQGMEREIFKKRPEQIFAWHDDCFTSCFYSFLKALENLENIIGEVNVKESWDKESQELAAIPLVVASDNVYGILTDPSPWLDDTEEDYLGALTLGKEINALFANEKDVDKVQDLVDRYGMHDKVIVESMDILKAAQTIDLVLGPYLYDVYSIRKWAKFN